MTKIILGLMLLLGPLALADEQYIFTTYNPGGYSTTMLNYFPTPMHGHGLRVTVRGCDATVTNVNTMTGGIGLASLDFRGEYGGGVTEWMTRSGLERTFLGIQLYTTNTMPAYCTYVIEPLP